MKFASKIVVACVGALSLLAGPAYSVTVEVAVQGLEFMPPDVTIDVGDSVHWTGLSFHNVAQSADAASEVYDGTGFRSGEINAVTQFTHTFNTAGMFFYICEPHAPAGMKGTVTVNAGPVVPAMNAWGIAALMGLVTAMGSVVLWKRRRPSVALALSRN